MYFYVLDQNVSHIPFLLLFPQAKIKEAKWYENWFKYAFWHTIPQAVALSVYCAELKLVCSWYYREHAEMLIR